MNEDEVNTIRRDADVETISYIRSVIQDFITLSNRYDNRDIYMKVQAYREIDAFLAKLLSLKYGVK